MKIVFPLLSLEHHGGTRDIVEIANYLASRGHKIVIYVPEDRFTEHYPVSKKVQVKKISQSGKGFFNQLRVLLWYTFNMEKADLYVANFFPTFYPVFVRSIFTKIPFVYFVQDIESRFVKFPLNTFAILTYLIPSRKIALSTYIKNSLKFGYIEVARAGVSNVFLEKPVRERNFNFPLTIGHIYRRERLKNSRLFLKALPDILKAGFKVTIVANARDIPFRDKNLKVIPYGNSEYLREAFYDKIDILIHTSFIEGFGLPPLEAMARGCVVILTQSGGPSEYANLENSIMIDKYDSDELVLKILKIKDNKQLLKKLSSNAIKTARAHPMTRLGEEFEIALSKLKLLK